MRSYFFPCLAFSRGIEWRLLLPDEWDSVWLGWRILFELRADGADHFGEPFFVVIHGHSAEWWTEVIAGKGGGVKVEDVHGVGLSGVEIEKLLILVGWGEAVDESLVIAELDLGGIVFQEELNVFGVFRKSVVAL